MRRGGTADAEQILSRAGRDGTPVRAPIGGRDNRPGEAHRRAAVGIGAADSPEAGADAGWRGTP